jgi:hypothetical protein
MDNNYEKIQVSIFGSTVLVTVYDEQYIEIDQSEVPNLIKLLQAAVKKEN